MDIEKFYDTAEKDRLALFPRQYGGVVLNQETATMSCAKTIKTKPMTITATSTNDVFDPLSAWMPVTGLNTLDFRLNLLTIGGNIVAKPGIQLASVRSDQPDDAAAIGNGSFVSSVGFHHFREAETGSSKAFFRVGVVSKLSSGSVGSGQVELGVTMDQCGRTLSPASVTINPGQLNTTASFFPVSNFLSIVGAGKLKAMFIVTDNESSYMEYRLVARTATDESEPNPWVAVEAAWTNPSTANTSRNSGELVLPTDGSFDAAGNSVMQLGVAVRKKSGATGEPRASILTLPAVRY